MKFHVPGSRLQALESVKIFKIFCLGFTKYNEHNDNVENWVDLLLVDLLFNSNICP